MNLQEKIYDCRKKAGLSQEALAEKIGVSRQAISKWETGEAIPEVGKLLLLAKTFGVTTDWLLSEDEPEGENEAWKEGGTTREEADGTGQQSYERQPQSSYPGWIDNLPTMISRLFKRFGWLVGVYVTVIGGMFAGLGALARGMVVKMANSTSGMFGSFDSMFGGDAFDSVGDGMFDNFENAVNQMMNQATLNNPVYTFGTGIMWFGIVVMIAGVVLAIVLKHFGRANK